MFYNLDCCSGAMTYLRDNSIDCIITDPPYGIDGQTLHKHYNRHEHTVVEGYIDVDAENYEDFSNAWIEQAARVLKPGGLIFVVSGYSRLPDVMTALQTHGLREVNHIIWKYSFGVWTKNKFVSSHYHILLYRKPGKEKPLNHVPDCTDDVWTIPREYRPGETKNKNQLPRRLLQRMICLGSEPGDMVCDFFLGSFSTAIESVRLGRRACGFELNTNAFDFGKAAYDEAIRHVQDQPQPTITHTSMEETETDTNTMVMDATGEVTDPNPETHLIICRTRTCPPDSWFTACETNLAKGGSLFLIVPPQHVLNVTRKLRECRGFQEINHIIWKTHESEYRSREIPCVHEHILFYSKKGSRRTFITYSRFQQDERTEHKRSKNYADREDVFISCWRSNSIKLDEPKELHTWSDIVEKLMAYCWSPSQTIHITCSDPHHQDEAEHYLAM